MKICFVGLGAIGKRHCENLIRFCQANGITLELHALRSQNGTTPLPEIIQSHLTRQAISECELDEQYDAVFITNPTNLHYNSLRQFANRSQYFFIEKPVFDRLDVDLTSISLGKDTVCYVAAPLRYCGVLKELKKILDPQKVYCARAICSSYLPEWRPGVDYRKVYSANKETGGGVCIDLIHEWDYLSVLFGIPLEVFRMSGTYSDLDITSEDLAVYIAKYDRLLVELHLDYFGREPRRGVELFTKERTIYADIAHGCISFSDGTPAIICREDRNAMYEREMSYFMHLILNQIDHSTNDIEHAMKIMHIALGGV